MSQQVFRAETVPKETKQVVEPPASSNHKNQTNEVGIPSVAKSIGNSSLMKDIIPESPNTKKRSYSSSSSELSDKNENGVPSTDALEQKFMTIKNKIVEQSIDSIKSVKNDKEIFDNKDLERVSIINFRQILSPFEILTSELKYEKLSLRSQKGMSGNQVAFFFSSISDQLSKSNDSDFKPVTQLILLTRGEGAKLSISDIQKKALAMQKNAKAFEFRPSNEFYVFQKIGKMFGKSVKRSCSISSEFCVQVLEKGSKKPLKPRFFKEMEVLLQKKVDVDKTNSYNFEWPDDKNQNFTTRLIFTRMKGNKKKLLAIYFTDIKEAQSVKNNAIFQKLLTRSPQVKEDVLKRISNWRIIHTEFLYKQLLKFQKKENFDLISKNNETLKSKIRAFIKFHFPNSYESSRQIDYLLDSNDTQDQLGQQILKIDEESADKNPAEIVNHNSTATTSDIQPGQFSHLRAGTPIDKHGIERELNMPIKEFEPGMELNENLLQFFEKNAKFILSANRLVISTQVSGSKGTSLTKKEIDELGSLEFSFMVEHGYARNNISAFLSHCEDSKFVYRLNTGFKIIAKSLKSLRFAIISVAGDKMINESLLDISGKLLKFEIENKIEVPVSIKLDNSKKELEGILFLSLVIVPRNLEAAHLIFTQKLIQKNSNRFKEIVDASENLSSFEEIMELDRSSFRPFSDIFDSYWECGSRFLPSIDKQYGVLANIKTNKGTGVLREIMLKASKEKDILILLDITLQELERQNPTSRSENEWANISLLQLINHCLLGENEQERFQIQKTIFKQRIEPFLNIDSPVDHLQASAEDLRSLIEELDCWFQIHPASKIVEDLTRRLAVDVLVLLQSNIKQGKLFLIRVGRIIAPIVSKFVASNPNQHYSELKLIALTSILNSLKLSEFNSEFIDSDFFLLSRFAIMFAELRNKKNSETIASFGIEKEQLFAKLLATQFSEETNTLTFLALSDVKACLQLVLECISHVSPPLKQIFDLKFSFASIMDSLLLGGITGELAIDSSTPSDLVLNILGKTIHSVLQDNRRCVIIILKGLRDLIRNPSILSDLETLTKDFSNQKKIHSGFSDLKQFIQITNIQVSEIQQVVHDEFISNEVVSLKMTSLFPHEQNTKDYESFKENLALPDPFFEACHSSPWKLKHISLPSKEEQIKLKIDFLEPKLHQLINESSQANVIGKSVMLSKSRFETIFNKLVKGDSSLTEKVYEFLCSLKQSDEISIFTLIVFMTICSCNNMKEIYSNLLQMAENISLHFSSNDDEIFSEVAQTIMKEFISFKGFEVMPFHLKYLIYSNTKHQITLNSAVANLSHDILIDLTVLFRLHFNTCVNKSNAFQFTVSPFLVKQLQIIFQELETKNTINSLLKRFEVNLIFNVSGQKEIFVLPFKILRGKNFKIISKLQSPIEFPILIKSHPFLSKSKLEKIMDGFSITKIGPNNRRVVFMTHLKKMIKLNLLDKESKNILLTIEVLFKTSEDSPMVIDMSTWVGPRLSNNKDFTFKEKLVKVNLHYTYFLLPLNMFIKAVLNRVLPMINEEEIYKFVRIFGSESQVCTQNGKAIPNDAFLFDVKEIQKDLANKDFDISLSVIYG